MGRHRLATMALFILSSASLASMSWGQGSQANQTNQVNQTNSAACFDGKKEISVPNTKYNLSLRGEILSAGVKIATLALPTGFIAECAVATTMKTDTLILLSLKARDYDEKTAFIFRLSAKDSKVVWSQYLKEKIEPSVPFTNDKYLVLGTFGEVISLNPDTGVVRWKFSSKETEGLFFKKFSLQNNVLQAEAVKAAGNDTTAIKFELYIGNGTLVPAKK